MQRQRRREERVARFLDEEKVAYQRELHVDFKCALGSDDSKSFCRIDFVVQQRGVTFCIEVDEQEHSNDGYLLSCETRRMTDAYTSLAIGNPALGSVVWVRFNPDSFSIDGVKQKVLVKDRLEKLLTVLNTYVPTKAMTVIYLYYTSLEGAPLILGMPDFPEALKELVDMSV